jgi:hypothetical protein
VNEDLYGGNTVLPPPTMDGRPQLGSYPSDPWLIGNRRTTSRPRMGTSRLLLTPPATSKSSAIRKEKATLQLIGKATLYNRDYC